MKKKLAIGLGSTIIILALVMTIGISSVFADTQTEDSEQSFVSRCVDAAQKGYGIVSEAIQELLDMSGEEIQAEREEGKTLLDIAEDRDVAAEEITGTIMEAKKDRLEEAVESEVLTKEQADERLGHMEERIEYKLNNGWKSGGLKDRSGCRASLN